MQQVCQLLGEVEKGNDVTVTVNMASPVMAVEFELSYDASKFSYVDGSANAGNLGTPSVKNENGHVNLAIAASDGQSQTETVTLTFTALEPTKKSPFTISNLISDTDNTITEETAVVTVPGNMEESSIENDGDTRNWTTIVLIIIVIVIITIGIIIKKVKSRK